MEIIKKITPYVQTAWQKTKDGWKWYKSLFIGTPWWKKSLGVLIALLVMFFAYLGAVDVNLFWLFGKSPGFAAINKAEVPEASVIYTCDGKQIGKFFNENRTPVEFDDVNPVFWQCLIDTEDERFYHHWGIDFPGIFGAIKDAATGRGGRGASTITQQLAKNMFRVRTQYSTGLLGKIPGIKILIVKTKEWIIATKLELCHSKSEILTMYANTVDFGSNAFGIKTACKTYFKTTPKDLTVDQAAILVGMLKATTYYNPKINPENSLKRRNQVLENMLSHGDITQIQCDTLKQKGITLNYTVENNYDGQAQYFREAVADELKKWCEENGVNLYTDGLKIHTTIDSRMQKYAEEGAAKQMKQIQSNFNSHWGSNEPWADKNGKPIRGFVESIVKQQPVYKYLTAKYPDDPDSVKYYLNLPHPVKVFTWENEKHEVVKELSVVDSVKYMLRFMHCSMVAMEPETGHVKAYVGDIDFKSWKYDKARAKRQPGSTFKLFVYTEAMNQGLTPCDKRRDEYFAMESWDPVTHKQVTWAPKNAEGYFTGDSMPLKTAFAKSINSVAVRLGQEMGIKRIAETAHKMGVKTDLDDSAPSLVLGSSDVNLFEMVNSYCTVANDGKHHDPVLVTSIEDRNGKIIYYAADTEEQVIPYKSAFFMQKMLLSGTHDAGGTSQSLRSYIDAQTDEDTDFGGKTGTSNNHSDAWFIGVSPKLVVGAWVGGEYRCIHFRTGALGQGARTALPICGYFLKGVMGNKVFRKYHAKFGPSKDSSILDTTFDCPRWYRQDNDSLDRDSLIFQPIDMPDAEEINLDDDINGSEGEIDLKILDEI